MAMATPPLSSYQFELFSLILFYPHLKAWIWFHWDEPSLVWDCNLQSHKRYFQARLRTNSLLELDLVPFAGVFGLCSSLAWIFSKLVRSPPFEQRLSSDWSLMFGFGQQCLEWQRQQPSHSKVFGWVRCTLALTGAHCRFFSCSCPTGWH